MWGEFGTPAAARRVRVREAFGVGHRRRLHRRPDDGATNTWRDGSAMEAIRLSELARLRDALARHEVESLLSH